MSIIFLAREIKHTLLCKFGKVFFDSPFTSFTNIPVPHQATGLPNDVLPILQREVPLLLLADEVGPDHQK